MHDVAAMARMVEEMEGLGGRTVFGLPGTQNVSLFEALRSRSFRTVQATSELAASFMAVGYGRASGRPGILATIPGPGVAYAVPGLAEARLDSVPLVHLVTQDPQPKGKTFRLQEIDHASLLRSVAKSIIQVEPGEDPGEGVARAWELARAGEPGPVVLWIGEFGNEGPVGGPEGRDRMGSDSQDFSSRADVQDLMSRVRASRRPVFFLGLGAVDASDLLREVAETLNAPVITTPSARGILPEDHPLSLGFDVHGGGLDCLNELLGSTDLILALGCKLGHNGTGGFRLTLPKEFLVHVNTDPNALGANYPASSEICASVRDLAVVLQGVGRGEVHGLSSTWDSTEIEEWKGRLASAPRPGPPEPLVPAVPSGKISEVLGILRSELPRDAIVVTDSGFHQTLVRRYFPILSPRGLITPSDFQSMGFGLPAAIGAAVAVPDRKVVVVVGDGGLAMSGMELLSLRRERLPITVVVFNDGHLNLIRLQQERDFGHAHATGIDGPDLEGLAAAVGVDFMRWDRDLPERIREASKASGPVLVDLPLTDSTDIRRVRRRAAAKAMVRQAVGETGMDRLKRFLGRGREGRRGRGEPGPRSD